MELFYSGVRFVLIPILEIILPLDNSNFDTETKDKRIINKLFDWMLYANIPIVFGLLFYFLWAFSQVPYAPFELVGLIISLGIVLGTNGINVAHELGHRANSPMNAFLESYCCCLLCICISILNIILVIIFMRLPRKILQQQATINRYIPFGSLPLADNLLKAWKIQLKLLDNQKRWFLSFKNDMLWYT